MKLPELKKKFTNKYAIRIVAGVLTVALLGSGMGDGSLSHYSSLRSFRLDRFFDSLKGRSRWLLPLHF